MRTARGQQFRITAGALAFAALGAGQPSKSQCTFLWNELGWSELQLRKETADLIIILRPNGTFRYFSDQEGFWRIGPAADAEFCFPTKGEAMKFCELLFQTATGFGAKITSMPTRTVDNRVPHRPTPKQKAKIQKMMDYFKNDPGFQDRVFPPDTGPPLAMVITVSCRSPKHESKAKIRYAENRLGIQIRLPEGRPDRVGA